MSDTQLIKDKLDIVDFINEYVPLKPAGINHKGLCPFHQEKSPSFMVSRERQNWHCFGCSIGGDIFSFAQKIEGMEFIDALKFLANRAGVELKDSKINQAESSQKSRIKEINVLAARFFHHILINLPVAKPARDYLEMRGLKSETIDAWQIGFIPEQWDLLTKYLLNKGFSINDLVASGMVIKRDDANSSTQRGFYDRFRGRIMFPIWDVHDSVVGFTGRVLVETENSGGKYVNTPQTILYDKSRVIFGLNRAKKTIKEKNLAVLVEGQMDVIACHQAGMMNVVATSGTALTEWQIELLKRYTNNIAMAFDADLAGQNAAKRGIDLAREAGISLKIIKIPDGAGKDPDECLKKNPEMWWQAVEQAHDVMEWLIAKSLEGKNLTNASVKQIAVNEILREIARIPFATERDHWLKNMAARIGEEVAVLRENMQEVKNASKQKISYHSQEKEQIITIIKTEPKDRLYFLLQRLFVLLLKFSKAGRGLQWLDGALSATVKSTKFSPLYEFLKDVYTDVNNPSADWSLDKLRSACEITESENLVDVLLLKGELDFFGLTEKEAFSEAHVLEEAIKTEWKKKSLTELTQAIRVAEGQKDQPKIDELLADFSRLN
ncbi:MAG: DNA primase [Candidatus Magasanikbacteria bacterium RIFCSPHIGHO2_01_FULL_41_23]|uniref:DNA primase n=1 Tax=Candidatus Magasanikbacteria bacterium RIFCSPLOWO2_01_FULL_40_15 TaxID=1798686 RepID=A0A1F6N3W7_9BACT|nr:MAG: DNA primase [Candidatus Magasanikbacteria bacterium RIFCSPHIGHO2_01_FULL_41_23]OGH76593.1 MAG: DNA primase [Candidatus Magasanikbacteria bacterium RIFCSPHIGHO2_12_FULL_41_16]OGH78571.1 MAG: DNA primase [Candidatus Magasanikbacteria bacterium RIFCSPLOWO2_01_FULL_40_15]